MPLRNYDTRLTLARPVCQDIRVDMAAMHSGLTPAKILTRLDLSPRISLTSVTSHHESQPRARFGPSLVITDIRVRTIPLQNGQICPQWQAGLFAGLYPELEVMYWRSLHLHSTPSRSSNDWELIDFSFLLSSCHPY